MFSTGCKILIKSIKFYQKTTPLADKDAANYWLCKNVIAAIFVKHVNDSVLHMGLSLSVKIHTTILEDTETHLLPWQLLYKLYLNFSIVVTLVWPTAATVMTLFYLCFTI